MTEERYEIRGKIGQGGVGAVYKAYDTQLRREVAIKRVLADGEDAKNDTATQNLLKEATALSSVQHPHICTVYDAGIDEEGPFVVMELINGKTLDQMVEKGTLTYEDFREVAIQSEEAMIAAQELNLVHRDLKPSNVMVSWLPSGRFQIKLVDFGLAKFSAKPSLQTIDHGDAVFGSIFFMAPEQFERTPLDQRTDMYSLGAMFYYTLAGHYPFDGDSAPQVMASHLQGTVVPLQQVRPDLPVWLCEWVMWHIQRHMEHRPNSAKDALEKFLHDEGLASQGGHGATQQLVTPGAPKTGTAQLLVPGTGPQQVQAAGVYPSGTITSPIANVTPNQHQSLGATPTTGPQPILTPAGSSIAHNVTQSLAAAHSTPVSVTSPAGHAATHPPTPTTQPLTPEEEAQFLAGQKKGMSKTKKKVIFSMLGVGIVIAAVALIIKGDNNETNKTYNRLVTDIQGKQELPITKDELNILLDAIAGSPNVKDRIRAYIALTKAKAADDSFSAPLIMARFAINKETKLTPATRKKLFEAISFNKPYNDEAFAIMLEYAKANPDEPCAEQAVGQIQRVPIDQFFNNILTVHDSTKEPKTKTKSASSMIAIIEQSKDKAALSNILVERYQTTDADREKLSYIRIMGATGTDESLEILTEMLNSDKAAHVQAAAKGLSNWPNLKPANALIDAYADATSSRSRIRKHILDFLTTNENSDQEQLVQSWKNLIRAAESPKETRQIIGWLTREDNKTSDTILEYILTIPNFDSDSVELAKETLKKRKNK